MLEHEKYKPTGSVSKPLGGAHIENNFHDPDIEESAYALALAELESGPKRLGIWAKAIAESGGDEAKAKAKYIELRARSELDMIAAQVAQLTATNNDIPHHSVLNKKNSSENIVSANGRDMTYKDSSKNQANRPPSVLPNWVFWVGILAFGLAIKLVILNIR